MKKVLCIAIIAVLFASCTNETRLENTPLPDQGSSVNPQVEKDTPYNGGFTKDMRVSDALAIAGIMERSYAPRALKEEFFDLSFEAHSQKFIDDAAKDMTDEEFYVLIAKYLAAFKDAHVSWRFPSSATAYLGFKVRDVGGRLYVTSVAKGLRDRISVGDELVSLDGVPALSARDELLEFTGMPTKESDLQTAAYVLTFRRQSFLGFMPKKDAVKAVFSPASGGEDIELNLLWSRNGREFARLNDEGAGLKGEKIAVHAKADQTDIAYALLHQGGIEKAWSDNSVEPDPKPYFDTGKDFIPRKEGPFPTGVFVRGDKKIGYIRLHTFATDYVSWDDALSELEEELAYFEEDTDALIIDTAENGGGNGCFMQEIASMFFDKPVKQLRQRLRANRALLANLEYRLMQDGTSKEDARLMEEMAGRMRLALGRGELVTDAFPLCDPNEYMQPYENADGKRVSYSKPMIVTVNEMSASAADMFAVLLQDLGRAKIFGVQSMGAGGSKIPAAKVIGYSEMSLNLTAGIVLREKAVVGPNGKETYYVENTGAIPDVVYEPTLDDIMTYNSFYREALLRSAEEMMPAKANQSLAKGDY